MVLDSLKMPLIHEHYDFVSFAVVDLFKQVLVLFINEDALELREEGRRRCGEPVDLILVQTLLGKCCGSY